MVVALSDAYALHAQTGSGVTPGVMAAATWRLTERELGLEPARSAPAGPDPGDPTAVSVPQP